MWIDSDRPESRQARRHAIDVATGEDQRRGFGPRSAHAQHQPHHDARHRPGTARFAQRRPSRHRQAPPPPAADSSGTLRIPTSADRIKIGSTMHANVNPPARIENPIPSTWQKNTLPNNPKTIDGTPASTSRLKRTACPTARSASPPPAASPSPARSGPRRPGTPPRISPVETRIGPMPAAASSVTRRLHQKGPRQPPYPAHRQSH